LTDRTPAALRESRLYTFIDEAREFALYFLEGQKLIHDLALLHPIQRAGFAYFRDVVLSVQPMIALLKHGEQIGFYLDSAEPLFRLKIETNHEGAVRCMLLPENFQEFPESVKGLVRVLKLFPNNKLPYESILEIDGLALREIVNRVLLESYQVNSAVLVSQSSDQSAMLHQLPLLPQDDDYEYSPERLRARRLALQDDAEKLFSRALAAPEEIKTAFGEIGFRCLASRTVRFFCSCSREGMLANLVLVYRNQRDELFDAGQDSLEIKCEYCKSRYEISRDEVERAVDPRN